MTWLNINWTIFFFSKKSTLLLGFSELSLYTYYYSIYLYIGIHLLFFILTLNATVILIHFDSVFFFIFIYIFLIPKTCFGSASFLTAWGLTACYHLPSSGYLAPNTCTPEAHTQFPWAHNLPEHGNVPVFKCDGAHLSFHFFFIFTSTMVLW